MSMTIERAEAIIERAINTNKNIAIFLIGGVCKTTSMTTDLFRAGMEKHPDKLVGVYDMNADYRWIMDDVAYMAAKS